MSYVENCKTHGQYKGDYCGECVETAFARVAELEAQVERVTEAWNECRLEKRNLSVELEKVCQDKASNDRDYLELSKRHNELEAQLKEANGSYRGALADADHYIAKNKELEAELSLVKMERSQHILGETVATERVSQLEKDNIQLGKNVQFWMEESFLWGKKSREDRAESDKLKRLMLLTDPSVSSECMNDLSMKQFAEFERWKESRQEPEEDATFKRHLSEHQITSRDEPVTAQEGHLGPHPNYDPKTSVSPYTEITSLAAEAATQDHGACPYCGHKWTRGNENKACADCHRKIMSAGERTSNVSHSMGCYEDRQSVWHCDAGCPIRSRTSQKKEPK